MVLIGLVSDTHDNTPLAAQAAAFFRERRVDHTFHLGDVTQPESLEPFEGMPLTVVRGNNDDHLWPDTHRQEFAGVKVGATHGHHRGLLKSLQSDCDVILHGHTHARRADRVDGKLIVNPGALYRTWTKTCALLELPAKRVVFYEVRPDGVHRL